MAVTYKLLLCGKNQVIIDEFYEHMERGYDLLTASPRFSDLVRHIELFRPDMVVVLLLLNRENEKKNLPFSVLGF